MNKIAVLLAFSTLCFSFYTTEIAMKSDGTHTNELGYVQLAYEVGPEPSVIAKPLQIAYEVGPEPSVVQTSFV